MTTVRAALLSPAQTVRRLAAHPSPLAWIAGTAFVLVAARVALLATAVGRQAFIDQWVQRAEAFGVVMDDATFARITSFGAYAPAYGAAMGVALGLLLPVVAAAGLRLSGPRGTSWAAALTLAGYAGLPLALRDVVALPVSYLRESLASPLTLGTFAPMLDEASPAARFLWSVDLFVVWWTVIVGLAAASLTGRRALPVVTALSATYAVAGLLLAVTMLITGGA
ncbi:MAG: hypothetical protein AB7I25_02360 [Vicinamibacterales bacterium]